MMMYGCGKKEEPVQKKEETQEKDPEEGVLEENTDEKDATTMENDSENNSVNVLVTKMKIYYADLGTGEIISKEIESDNVTPEIVWKQLQIEGVINEECKLNQYIFHNEEKKIDMDVNGDFGNYVRSMGTMGEDMVVTCITRSYLETYGYEGIKITEDGKVLETGHAVLDKYMGIE